MVKKEAIDFQSFLFKLKAERIIDDIGALTAEEKVILKDAFGKGKNLNKTNPELADDIEKAIAEGDFGKLVRLINNKVADEFDLFAEEALGGHSLARHGEQLSMVELEQRVMGTHSTMPQSRSALKFDSADIHKEAVNKAYQHFKSEIDAHFASGGQYKEWTFDFGSQTGQGYTNTGTRSNPVSLRVTSNKVTISLDATTANSRGYYLLSAFPAHP